jgi:hypothetical protein
MNGTSWQQQGTKEKRYVQHCETSRTTSHNAQVLWERILFGSTQSALGVYQIVAALQVIGAWCEEVYRPWFKTHVVGTY